MQGVDQTRFGFPGGNCFRASLASILELRLEDVPDFCNDDWDGDWESNLNRWLYDTWGLFSFTVDMEKSTDLEWLSDNCMAMAAVPSASGKTWTDPKGAKHDCLHSVVYFKNAVLHDPHPSRAHMESAPVLLRFFCLPDPAVLVARTMNIAEAMI